MFKHASCGGKHSTVVEARQCEAGKTKTPAPIEPQKVLQVPVAVVTPTYAPRPRLGDKPASEGFYLTPDGRYYKVQLALHSSGRPYAKKLIIISEAERDAQGKVTRRAVLEWEKATGWQFKLKEEWKLTLAQAGQFGHLYGQCIKCGLPLTKEESIARGMGDICAGLSGSIQKRNHNTRLYRAA
jgi:hypothetical protein